MTRFSRLLAGAVLAASVAAPAYAAIEPLGSVAFSRWDNHDAKLGNFRGDAVELTARGSDVSCDRVMATFGNGATREIFSGELRRGEPVTVDLPGGRRSVDRIDFDCRPLEGWRARVDIAANDLGYPNNPRLGFNFRYGPTYDYMR